MNNQIAVAALSFVLVTLAVSAQAQQAAKISRIGYLVASSRAVNATREEAFRQGVGELGYIDGQNFVIE